MIGLKVFEKPVCSIKRRGAWVPQPGAVWVDPNKPRKTMKEYRARLLAPKPMPRPEAAKS